MYFRLAAAIFDSQVTPTSESIQICAIDRVAGPQKLWDSVGILVISCSNHDIIITSGLTAAFFFFGGRGLTLFGS